VLGGHIAGFLSVHPAVLHRVSTGSAIRHVHGSAVPAEAASVRGASAICRELQHMQQGLRKVYREVPYPAVAQFSLSKTLLVRLVPAARHCPQTRAVHLAASWPPVRKRSLPMDQDRHVTS
jgi:hypothetical protein